MKTGPTPPARSRMSREHSDTGSEAQRRCVVRDAIEADMPAVQAIYAHHVLTGLASFEETEPSLEEMVGRFNALRSAGLPYLVATLGDTVAGYSYAGPYRTRPAYRYTVENSVYVGEAWQSRGVGRSLLDALIARCEAGPWHQMVAIIGDSANEGSITLHARAGFRMVGTLRDVGFKHGRWVDSVIMQRSVAPDGELPRDP